MLLLRVSDGSGRGGSSVGFNGGQSRRMMVLGLNALPTLAVTGTIKYLDGWNIYPPPPDAPYSTAYSISRYIYYPAAFAVERIIYHTYISHMYMCSLTLLPHDWLVMAALP